MATPIIRRLEAPDQVADRDLKSAAQGVEKFHNNVWLFYDVATETRIVYKGVFTVDQGSVEAGTVTGFDVFNGAVKVMTGSGYALTVAAVLKAHANAQDDYPAFYATFYAKVREIGSAGSDFMYGSEVSGKFFGKGGNDTLLGGPGKEVMKGGDGDDWLEGRGRADKLFGNAGEDIFAFTNADRANDPGADFAVHRVRDFDPKKDSFFLDLDRFTAIDAGPLGKSEFALGRKAKTPDVHFLYRKETGDLFYDRDGSGKLKKVLIAELDAGLKLKAHHFEADLVT